MPMKKPVPPLSVIDAETLSDKPLPYFQNVVADLLPPGLTILGGAPKVGKSWLMLDLCNHVANGEPFWGNEVRREATLYLCLEDTQRRLQNRINTITDSPSPASFLATEALSLAGGLCDQIRAFAAEHSDLVLVVIDTLQLVRGASTELSYAGDYGDVRQLKALADELGLSIVVIHHLRKMDDGDPLNKISGTTGLNGAADPRKRPPATPWGDRNRYAEKSRRVLLSGEKSVFAHRIAVFRYAGPYAKIKNERF